MTIGSARPLERGPYPYRELVRWMAAEYGFDEIDAYMLLSQGRPHAPRQYGRPKVHDEHRVPEELPQAMTFSRFSETGISR